MRGAPERNKKKRERTGISFSSFFPFLRRMEIYSNPCRGLLLSFPSPTSSAATLLFFACAARGRRSRKGKTFSTVGGAPFPPFVLLACHCRAPHIREREATFPFPSFPSPEPNLVPRPTGFSRRLFMRGTEGWRRRPKSK